MYASLILHFVPHPIGDSGVDTRSDDGPYRANEHPDFKAYLPPWRFVMTAFAGIFGIGWAWWQLRHERREAAATVVLVSVICFWGYAVYELLWWSFKF